MSSSATSTLRMFPYRKLNTATTIRLIQVLPGRGDDKIVCEIRTVDVKASPGSEYHALSYVWGDDPPTIEIFLQDIKTNQRYPRRLQKNLWQLLHQIRKQSLAEYGTRPTSTHPLLIWTDALCLNQEDDQEKAQQIPRMAAIYSRAEIVLAWLGTDEKLQAELERLRDCGDNVGFYDALNISGHDASELAKNSYWRRIWIVQEIVLARRPVIMAGDIIMEFSKLERQLLLNDWTRDLYQAPSNIGWNWLGEIIDLRAAERSGKRMPLWRIIQYLWENQKSRPADGIYGILGLVGSHSDGKSAKKFIAVDYQKSVVDIFFDTIFETRPPMNEYPTLLEDLDSILGDKGGNRPLDTHFALEKYLRGNKTSKRHKKAATTASRVNDAMRMLPMERAPRHERNGDSRSSFSREACHILKNPLIEPDFQKVTRSHHAAAVGFLLDFFSDDPRPERVKGPSPWRCAGHRAQRKHPIQGHVGTWEAQFYFSSSTDPVALCGERCASCDKNWLAFEIPEIGFYLQIDVRESVSPLWKDGRLVMGLFDVASARQTTLEMPTSSRSKHE